MRKYLINFGGKYFIKCFYYFLKNQVDFFFVGQIINFFKKKQSLSVRKTKSYRIRNHSGERRQIFHSNRCNEKERKQKYNKQMIFFILPSYV